MLKAVACLYEISPCNDSRYHATLSSKIKHYFINVISVFVIRVKQQRCETDRTEKAGYLSIRQQCSSVTSVLPMPRPCAVRFECAK